MVGAEGVQEEEEGEELEVEEDTAGEIMMILREFVGIAKPT